MTGKVQGYVELFDQRSLRERALVLITLLILLVFSWNVFILEPATVKRKRSQAEISRLETEITHLRTEAELVRQRATADPDLASRQRIVQLREVIGGLDRKLEARLVDLLSPREMPGLLQDLLKRQRALKLMTLENLQPLPMLTGVEGAESPPGLYRHGLMLELEGSYLGLLSYLKALEGLSQQVFWDILVIEAKAYPLMRVKLQVHTLSLSEDLIGV